MVATVSTTGLKMRQIKYEERTSRRKRKPGKEKNLLGREMPATVQAKDAGRWAGRDCRSSLCALRVRPRLGFGSPGARWRPGEVRLHQLPEAGLGREVGGPLEPRGGTSGLCDLLWPRDLP